MKRLTECQCDEQVGGGEEFEEVSDSSGEEGVSEEEESDEDEVPQADRVQQEPVLSRGMSADSFGQFMEAKRRMYST